ncbi:dTDP-4-dehydrorhamnose 3,5-epimerase [Martelella alba]|uniref:dTDP-4-dehydrorhamnose 3,5-epimerase n=1 Tax=Martelella alba TaxID=2590451 RepID=A0A506U597_9HYPH|nr:dTDP-4-dehydrorhamnose 3,5-epimerase [Martelella alba]TPW27097.1 dTDP-4-dehydrorhamnose 3,5-epimerase [Martelella alba]
MEIEQTAISGLVLLTPKRFGDSRGFFEETWNRKTMSDLGVEIDFVQDNHSLSSTVGTVRGLHFQAPPNAQAKLVRCGRGRLFDVAVDVRKGSPTYGQWFGVELSFENGKQLLIPEGFLHGFMTLEPETEIVYKCSDYYAPASDGGIRYNDPDIGIVWPLNGIEPVLSAKDAAAPFLSDFNSPFVF